MVHFVLFQLQCQRTGTFPVLPRSPTFASVFLCFLFLLKKKRLHGFHADVNICRGIRFQSCRSTFVCPVCCSVFADQIKERVCLMSFSFIKHMKHSSGLSCLSAFAMCFCSCPQEAHFRFCRVCQHSSVCSCLVHTGSAFPVCRVVDMCQCFFFQDFDVSI